MTEEQMKLINALIDCQHSIGFAQGVLMAIRTQAAQDASEMLTDTAVWVETMVKELLQKAGEQE